MATPEPSANEAQPVPDYTEHGRYFFHYTTRDAAFGDIIPKRRMRLSPYALMRDPLEATGPQLSAGFRVPDEPEAQQAIHATYFEAANEVQKVRAQTRLLSLTIDAPPVHEGLFSSVATFASGWARARMWEQYAEKHQGVCLVFERAAFEASVLSQLQERSPGAAAGAVSYSDGGLSETAAASLQLEPGVAGVEIARAHVQRHLGEFFFMKVRDWETEHEYRFIEPSSEDGYSYVDVGDALSAVIAGAQFPEWQRFSAINICQEAGIDLLHVFWEFMNRPMLGAWYREGGSPAPTP